MAMAGKCAVETWAEFGFLVTPSTASVQFDFGTHVFICTGSEEVYVFNTQEKKLTGVLQFTDSVSDLAQSDDKQHLFVACRNTVYCVNLTLVLPRLTATVSSSPAELKIPSNSLVIREEGVLSVLPVGSLLVTLSRRETSWLLTVYNTKEQSGCYELRGSFRLPVVSAGVEEKTATERSPVMICIYLSDAETSSSHRHVHLEPTLFKLLFGIDAALIKSPVILCGLPDGRLCSLPLRLPGMCLRALHSLEESVMFVGASVVKETDPGHTLCLVAVGEHGRVVVIKTCKGATEEDVKQVSFAEGCVPGPVTSACVDKHHLYFSTGSDLLSLNLSEELGGKAGQIFNEESTSKTSYNLQSPISLNVCRLIALGRPTYNTAGEVELLGLSVKGQLQKMTLPVGRGDTGSSTHLYTQRGRSVRDLLSAIGDVCERASVLKTAIKSKNHILQHLTQVLNVSFLIMDSTDTVKPSVRCHATARWNRLLQKDSLHLMCVLENSSPYYLEQGWTLSVTVFPLSCSDSSQEQSSSTNYSFPFCNLHPGQTFEVTLPLTAAGDASFPITVSCVLVYSLTTLLEEKQLAGLSKEQSSTISLPLNTLTVDWLHALQLNTPGTDRNLTSQSKINTLADTVQTFLKSRRMRANDKGEGEENKHYSVSVKVSSDLLYSSDVELKARTSPAVTLLDWLLSERHRGVTRYQWDRGAPNRTVLHAQGPNGHLVKLMVKEVDLGIEESLKVIEVQVESRSLVAVCGLHHAILHRIQTLMQRAPEKAAALRVHSLGLRQALQQAEHSLQQIQESRISRAFDAGVSGGQMTRSLLNVYQELRENPLVIL